VVNILPRVCDIEQGAVMVVTDLHGDWIYYQAYRDIFLDLKERNQVNTLVIAGDFIHSEGPPEDDKSLDIVLDLISLKKSLDSALIVLLVNHELPHIYHIPLSKGKINYTPHFEAVLGTHRSEVIDFFMSLPIYVRTRSGVSICHAGAFDQVHNPIQMNQVFTFSHNSLLQYAENRLSAELRDLFRTTISNDVGIPYADLVKHYLAVDQPQDARYDDYLIGAVVSQHPNFDLLWSALFSPNELQYGRSAYRQHVKGLLRALSTDYYHQNVLVTGHIGCRGGASILAKNQQLRLASGVHSHPKESAKYLIFDATQVIPHARALLSGLHLPTISMV
jgi:hypothetical protein